MRAGRIGEPQLEMFLLTPDDTGRCVDCDLSGDQNRRWIADTARLDVAQQCLQVRRELA